MRIALDYDQTYTADRKTWDDFIILMTGRGHEVCICTFRDRNHDWNPDLSYLEDTMKTVVHCTAGVAKAFWMENFGPGRVDIWIDDRPAGILNNSSMSPSQLAEWRADNKAAEAGLIEREKSETSDRVAKYQRMTKAWWRLVDSVDSLDLGSPGSPFIPIIIPRRDEA